MSGASSLRPCRKCRERSAVCSCRKRDELRHEIGAVRCPASVSSMSPVQPGNLVVLAIGVVVAALRSSELIAGEQHWSAVSEKYAGEHCSLDAGSGVQNCSIGRLTFNAPIGGIVLALAVFVVLAVGFVVVTAHSSPRRPA